MAEQSLQQRIINYLTVKPKKTETLNRLCQALKVPKKNLNQQLYYLKRKGRLVKVQQSPPVWKLEEGYLGEHDSHNQNAGMSTSTRTRYERGFVKGHTHKKKFHKGAFHHNFNVPKRYETPPERPVHFNIKEARYAGVSENIATLYHGQNQACMVRSSEKQACQSPGGAYDCDDDGTVAGDLNRDSFERNIFTDECSSAKSSTVGMSSLLSIANYESDDNKIEFVMDTDKDCSNLVSKKPDFKKEDAKGVCPFRDFFGLNETLSDENSCDSTSCEASGNDDDIKNSTLPDIEGFISVHAQSIENSNAPPNVNFFLDNDGSGTLKESVLLTNQASFENNKQTDVSDIDDCMPVLKVLKGCSGMTNFALTRQVPFPPDRLGKVLSKCVSSNFVTGSLKLWKITTAGEEFLNEKEIRHEADIFQGSCQLDKKSMRTYSGRPPSPRTILKGTEVPQTKMSTSVMVSCSGLVHSISSLEKHNSELDISQLQQFTISSNKNQDKSYKSVVDTQANASVINNLALPRQSVDSMQSQVAGFDSSVSSQLMCQFQNGTNGNTFPQMFLKCENPLKKNMKKVKTECDLSLITAGTDSHVMPGQQVMLEKPDINEMKYRTFSRESRDISVSSRSSSWPTMTDIPGKLGYSLLENSHVKHFRVARSHSTDRKLSGSRLLSASAFSKKRPFDLIDSLKKTSISSTEQSFPSKTTNQHNSLRHLSASALQRQILCNSIYLSEKQSPYDQNHSSANAPQNLLSLNTGNSYIPAKMESGSSRPVCGPPVPPGVQLGLQQLAPQSCAPRQSNVLGLSLSTESFNALNKNPVSALMEYAQIRKMIATVTVISQKGSSHNPIFEMAAFVGNRKFPSVMCNNKKDGKKEACDIALRQLTAEGQFHVGNFQNAVPLNNMTHFDKIASLTHQAFTALVSQIMTESFAGRKVIAGLVMKRSEDDTGVLVSLGTGNRCITGQQLSLQGNTVNDSHAEIIARRGFIRFLYKQLMEFNPLKDHPLFESSQCGKLQIRGNISFHLYISTAPCGDGALFSPRDADSSNMPVDTRIRPPHEPTFSSTVQGLLRTKVEGGEGTIPVEPGFTGQTFDGILRGERLLTMSCTDKICRWNVVGMQGALLSHFLEPVYLDSLTLGLLYDHGHLSRAVCCRVGQSKPDIHSLLPQGYRLNHPWLGRVTVCDPPREVQKTKSLSINWCFGDKGPEVTDGTQGLCCTSIEQRLFSRCSKRSLFNNYKALCEKFGRVDLLDVNSYNEAKASATDFVHAKQVLMKKFKDNGLGKWVSKPIEEDMFNWEEQT